MMSEKKAKMVSMRITQRQYDYLNDMAKRIRDRTGFRITRASIIVKMMEYGLPFLEKEFPDEQKELIEDESA
jgi:hypothetical protein